MSASASRSSTPFSQISKKDIDFFLIFAIYFHCDLDGNFYPTQSH